MYKFGRSVLSWVGEEGMEGLGVMGWEVLEGWEEFINLVENVSFFEG